MNIIYKIALCNLHTKSMFAFIKLAMVAM